MEFDEFVRVLGNDGSQRHRAAVGGENIDYPRMGIGVSGVGLRRLLTRAAASVSDCSVTGILRVESE
ncbi:hypothetical protein GCM10020255_077030 [Rhodococcus baikonurensis]